MTGRSDYVVIEGVEVLTDEGEVLTCRIYGGRYVVPKERLDPNMRVPAVGDEGELHVEQWYAEQEGMV